ncbi:substrate-binding domain-containing protein [Longispora albida]|uniref:substrate-binding domain-containing protein n=1 Tax=Longispora albida TaxID=203523 RepID=UPI0003A13051|nr:substrate-binding domain-containing protein [Longispora albida]
MPGDVTVISDLLEAKVLAPEPGEALRVGFAVPLSGTLGMVGPAALNCARLAAAEINAGPGLLGRPVELVLVDSGRSPAEVVSDVRDLAGAGAIHALVGTHASDVRVALAQAVPRSLPYVYTPPYEGGETSPGLYLLGETPENQLRPQIHYFVRRRRTRWAMVGNDYVWPRKLHAAARAYVRSAGGDVVAERCVPRGLDDPQPLVDVIARSGADIVLLTLIGADLVTFNRAFAASGLAGRVTRFAAALEENGLLGCGGDDSGELYASLGYFAGRESAFSARYEKEFGFHAPVPGGHAEGCYGGFQLLAALVNNAGSLHAADIDPVSDGVSAAGGRGVLTLVDRHVRQATYLARADGLFFEIVKTFS